MDFLCKEKCRLYNLSPFLAQMPRVNLCKNVNKRKFNKKCANYKKFVNKKSSFSIIRSIFELKFGDKAAQREELLLKLSFLFHDTSSKFTSNNFKIKVTNGVILVIFRAFRSRRPFSRLGACAKHTSKMRKVKTIYVQNHEKNFDFFVKKIFPYYLLMNKKRHNKRTSMITSGPIGRVHREGQEEASTQEGQVSEVVKLFIALSKYRNVYGFLNFFFILKPYNIKNGWVNL